MNWQKYARWGVALFAVVFAGVVYRAMGERQIAGPAMPVERLDPKASSEAISGLLRRLMGAEQEFEIGYATILGYPDGTTKFTGVRILSPERDGRSYVITAQDAVASANETSFELRQSIVLKASDGFELKTEAASFNTTEQIVRAPGAVSFARDGMNGSGVGMSYNEMSQVLVLDSESRVEMRGEQGAVTMSFESGTSTLDRVQNLLTLDGGVHVVRQDQDFDADRGVARLSENEDLVQYVELRGNARVSGAEAVDAMSARDIDLDYTDAGQSLERIVMIGDAAVALKPAGGAPAREVFGGRIDVGLAPDGTVTKLMAQEGVRLVVAGDGNAPPRTITARQLDATGETGKGLTAIQFDDAVDYREGGPSSVRSARARRLRLVLDGGAVSDAAFSGQVTFRDGPLEARAGEVRYAPSAGTLRLSGAEGGRAPHVIDERLDLSASAIDVRFETGDMQARGSVRTTIKPETAARSGGTGEPRTPGLLKSDVRVTVTSASLDYSGQTGSATFVGAAKPIVPVVLSQGETTIRAGRVVLDREQGNLTATGNSRFSLTTEKGESSEGTADEIAYIDKARVITYTSKAPAQSRLQSGQGDLRATTITISLEKDSTGVRRIDAEGTLAIVVNGYTATGQRLEYLAADGGSYTVYSGPKRPVTVLVPNDGTCRPMTGSKLTMRRGPDNIAMIVGMESEGKGRITYGSPTTCAPATPPRTPAVSPAAPAPAPVP